MEKRVPRCLWYGGEDETTAVSNFIADLSESSQMDQQPVPPDTQTASQPNDMVSPEMNTVDSGLLA